jgi:hypothetical protein
MLSEVASLPSISKISTADMVGQVLDCFLELDSPVSLGPIVRITPSELHIKDPSFYGTIYSGDSKRDKVLAHIKWAGTLGSAHATVDHDIHRVRRSAQEKLFSKGEVLNFALHIQGYANKLVNRISSAQSVIRLDDAFGCFTGDIITMYCFGTDRNFLDSPNFSSPFLAALHSLESTYQVMRHFPWLLPVLTALPERFMPVKMRSVREFERVSVYSV